MYFLFECLYDELSHLFVLLLENEKTFNSYYLKMGKLSMIWQMKKEAERDFTKFVKYVAELEEENKTLKEENVRLVKNLAEYKNEITDLKEENRNLKEKVEQMQENYENLNDAYTEILWENIKLRKELSAVYKAYHTAMWVDYNNEEDLYTIEDIEWHNAE